MRFRNQIISNNNLGIYLVFHFLNSKLKKNWVLADFRKYMKVECKGIKDLWQSKL